MPFGASIARCSSTGRFDSTTPTTVRWPQAAGGEAFQVCDLLDEVVYEWRGEWNYVRFDPDIRQAHVMRIVG